MEPCPDKGIHGIYQVGGCVRDKYLQVPHKDIDYAVEAESFGHMQRWVQEKGRIFVLKPEYGTIRASVGRHVLDFVLCRQDGPYSDKRRPDYTIPGTIQDDLSRRDFTVNAMALDHEGNLIDPFGGMSDLKQKLLRCVGNTKNRFTEDPLRLIRALRFHITKGFTLDQEIQESFEDQSFCEMLNHVVVDRRRDELMKCFMYNTPLTFKILAQYPLLVEACFQELWLKPTTEKHK